MTMTFTRTEHADGRVLSIHMTGVNTAAQSLANAPKLGQRVRETGYSGLIMNYQGCRFDHTVGPVHQGRGSPERGPPGACPGRLCL
jgi:hypothetical protein